MTQTEKKSVYNNHWSFENESKWKKIWVDIVCRCERILSNLI